MSDTPNLPEPWLRGPVAGIDPELQPVAHCLVQVREDVERAVAGLGAEALRARPGGAASLAFHLKHIPGSIDRLFTYADGLLLSDAQKKEAAAEKEAPAEEPSALLAGFQAGLERALHRLRQWPSGNLAEERKVGRAGLPSTVRGLLFHAAEHAQRHTGAALATAKIVRQPSA